MRKGAKREKGRKSAPNAESNFQSNKDDERKKWPKKERFRIACFEARKFYFWKKARDEIDKIIAFSPNYDSYRFPSFSFLSILFL